jgi:hypothetical protein
MVVSYSKVEMEMRLPSCLETLVTNHLFMQHHIPEGRIPQARTFFFATTFGLQPLYLTDIHSIFSRVKQQQREAKYII